MRAKLQLLASDAAIYGLTTLLTRSMSFLLTPLYTHYLSSRADFGIYSYLYSLLAFINVVYSFGLDTAFLRFFDKDNNNKTIKAFSFSWIGIASISILCTFICIFYADYFTSLIPELQGNADIIRAIALIPLFDALTVIPYSILRMQRKAKRFAMLRVINVAINLVLNIILVGSFHMGIWGIVVSGVISSLLAALFILPEIIQFTRPKIDTELGAEMLSFGLPTVPSAFSGMMLQVADRPIMTAMAGADMTGLYQANYRLGIPMMMLVSVFEFAYKPFYLTHYKDEGAEVLFARIFTYFTVLCAGLFLCISFFIGDIVQLKIGSTTIINASYWSGIGIIPIILAGYFFNGAATNFAAGLHIHKKTGWLPIATGIAAIVNISLNILLIPIWGMYGAAWATFAAYAISAGILFAVSTSIMPIPYEWKRIVLTILITIVLFFTVHYTHTTLIVRVCVLLLYPLLLILTGALNADEKRLFTRLMNRSKKLSI